MTIKVYIGSSGDIEARLAGTPNATTTTVSTVTDTQVFDLASATSFAASQTITVGKQRAIIDDISGTTVTLRRPLVRLPEVGQTVSHYDADYTAWRDQGEAFRFLDDLKTGGRTGSNQLSSIMRFFDHNNLMVDIRNHLRMAIFDDADPDVCLFGGVVKRARKIARTKNTSQAFIYEWQIEARGYAEDANNLGIEEPPATNVNAGRYLRYLLAKYTNMAEGEIDITNSPTIDFIRLGNFKRFTDVGDQLVSLWPGAEFFVKNTNTGGEVYFREAASVPAPFLLNEDLLNLLGNYQQQGVEVERNEERVYNIVRFPFYQEQWRAPDFHVQTVTINNAYLKHSVVLNGTPSNLEESMLAQDDFASELGTDFVEDDLTNPSPPTGYGGSDGFLIAGEINGVRGLHLLDATGSSGRLGDIGRQTDVAEIEPFTGDERQLIMLQEIAINTLGEAVLVAVVDQSSYTALIRTGSTSTSLILDDATPFVIGDRIEVDSQKTYITNKVGNTLTVNALSGAPSVGEVVSLHRLAYSRIDFGLRVDGAGALKKIINGVDSALSPAITVAAGQSYSLRLYMESYEASISATPSAVSVTVDDATYLTTGDVVEVFSLGDKNAPEIRTINKSGNVLTFDETLESVPEIGYRVRTKPKINVQIKGGAYGSVTGRTWTTIYSAPNTYQTDPDTAPDGRGVGIMWGKSFEGTLGQFWMKNPIPVTANVAGRYLHIGTQEVETSEPDVDVILRKVGSHFQLDFFPDTVGIWESGSTLELRYKERWLTHLDVKDIDSLNEVALSRGFTIDDNTTEDELVRKGGNVLDTIQLLPNPLSITEALTQARSILEAAKEPTFKVYINTTTEHHPIVQPGMILESTYEDIPSLKIERVEFSEIYGVNQNGRSAWQMRITAGSLDRLEEVLVGRLVRSGNRLVLDDGVSDDSYTRLQQVPIGDMITLGGEYTTQECVSPTRVVTADGVNYVEMICLSIA